MPLVVIWDIGMYTLPVLFEHMFFLCGCLLYANPESWPVVGFCPLVKEYGGVRDISERSLSHSWVLLRRCFTPRTRLSDYTALLLPLSHRNASMVGAAPSVRKAELGALLVPDQKTDLSHSAFITALCGINL